MNPVWIPTPSPRTHAMASQVELFAPADEDCSNADTSRTAEYWEKALKAVMLDALLDEHPAQRLMNLAALVCCSCNGIPSPCAAYQLCPCNTRMLT